MRALLVVPGVVRGLEVLTMQGPVVGEERQETDPRTGQQVRWTQYLNIPYAAAPVGERRFRPPSKPDPWLEPRQSSRLQQNLTICPQLGGPGGGLYGRSDEDCLYLHLAVPPVSPPSLSTAAAILVAACCSALPSVFTWLPVQWRLGAVFLRDNFVISPIIFRSLMTASRHQT